MSIKLYSLYTPSHEKLKNDWFLPTIEDDYELIIEHHEQEGHGNFAEKDFYLAVSKKIEVILRAITENWGNFFIFSDVDVQFFGKTWPVIKRLIRERDLLFQVDTPRGMICTGFFVCKANQSTKSLWEMAQKMLCHERKFYDQDTINKLLSSPLCLLSCKRILVYALARILKLNQQLYFLGHKLDNYVWSQIENEFKVSVGLLPTSFFGAGTFSERVWTPEMRLVIPTTVIMHHANYCVGIENKIKQLSHVRKIVESKMRS